MGSRGAYRSGMMSAEEIEAIQWAIKCNMTNAEARREVNELLKGKEIITPIYDNEHSTGLIKFNSNGRNDVLTDSHSITSEHKWVVLKFQQDYHRLNVDYMG